MRSYIPQAHLCVHYLLTNGYPDPGGWRVLHTRGYCGSPGTVGTAGTAGTVGTVGTVDASGYCRVLWVLWVLWMHLGTAQYPWVL